MGLTIHYEFFANVAADGARRMVDALREEALRLAFDTVGAVEELGPRNAEAPVDIDESPAADWLRLRATHHVEHRGAQDQELVLPVPPVHVIAFRVQPKGAETVYFGLASRPAWIEHVVDGAVERVACPLADRYTWHASCKTQYAALPASGGRENFLRVHKGIVRLLDHATSIGIKVAVRDEGGYWDSRDDDALLRKLDEWNVMVAGIVGAFKDAASDRTGGGTLLAPITGHPNFEHLEARGRPPCSGPNGNGHDPPEPGKDSAPG